jgi:hypothetical protein
MTRTSCIFLCVLASCGPSSPPDDPDSRSEWVMDRLGPSLVPASYLHRESEEECADRLSAAFDRFLGEALNRYPEPPVDEIRQGLARRGSTPPFIHLLGWEPVPGSPDLLIPYGVALSATSGSTRLRLARWSDGRFHLVRPSGPEVRAAERELGLWRGGDLHARYGPPYRPHPLTLEGCCDIMPPVLLRSTGSTFRFALQYCIPSTCPGAFDVVWSCDQGTLLPIGYSWECTASQGWRPSGEKPLPLLRDEIIVAMPYEGK